MNAIRLLLFFAILPILSTAQEWTFQVRSLAYAEELESACDVIDPSGLGVARIDPNLIDNTYYWTEFKLRDFLLEVKPGTALEIRIKNLVGEAGIPARDIGIYMRHGITNVAGATYMFEPNAVNYTFANVGNVILADTTALVLGMDDWAIFRIEFVDEFTVKYYYNSVEILSLSSINALCFISSLRIFTKGSGSLDWVSFYEGTNQIYFEDFTSCTNFIIPPMDRTTICSDELFRFADTLHLCVNEPYPLLADETFCGVQDFTWSHPDLLNDSLLLNPIIRTPQGTHQLTLTADHLDPLNLIRNGDFESGTLGINTPLNYLYQPSVPNNELEEGFYTVGVNPQESHSLFALCVDRSTDVTFNMMLVNPNVGTEEIWCQNISVEPFGRYQLKAWGASLYNAAPTMLQFYVNGIPIGDPLALTTTCSWTPLEATWESNAVSQAKVCIVNLNGVSGGNDFTLDEISMYAICTTSDTLTIITEPCAEVCGNGLDDDFDGAFDCLDSDCDCGACSINHGNVWAFGSNALLDFNTVPPTVSSSAAIDTWEGCSVFCDVDGNLVIYTDGSTVYNRNHQIMSNGTDLLGHSSSTQSGVIIPYPASDHQYFIFTVDVGSNGNGLSYSIVDLHLDNGLGEVTTKNVSILSGATEQLTAIRHCNNRDYWLLGKQRTSDSIYVYPVNENGIQLSNPFIFDMNSAFPTGFGSLKASVDGSRLALATGKSPIGSDRLELFDFDNETGIISNQITLATPNLFATYGIEFSPNGNLLYATNLDSITSVVQFDLLAGDATAIVNSKVVLDETPERYIYGSLQLAPDGKIYIARNKEIFLSAIEAPNVLGLDCSYVDNAIVLTGGAFSGLGLPNFVSSYLYNFTIALDAPTLLCDSSETVTIKATYDFTCSIDSFYWGLPSMAQVIDSNVDSITLRFSTKGAYQVTYHLLHACGLNSESIDIEVQYPLTNTADIHPSCEGEDSGTIVLLTEGGTAPYVYTWSNGGANNPLSGSLSAGAYWVTITDAHACSFVDQFIVPEVPEMQVDILSVDLECFGDSDAWIEASVNACEPVYNWSTGQDTSSIDQLSTGWYTLTVTDCYGCSVVETIFVRQPDSLVFITTTQAPNCLNGLNGKISVDTILGGTLPFEISKDSVYFDPIESYPFLINDLPAGLHRYFIKDANDCWNRVEVEIDIPIDLAIEWPTEMAIELGDSFLIDPQFNFPWDSLVAQDGYGFICENCPNFYYRPLQTSVLTISAFDEFGCSVSTQMLVSVDKARKVFMPSAFSPNEDGFNDTYLIFPSDNVVGIQYLKIYDRWGTLLYEVENIDPMDHSYGWDGILNGRLVPIGVYVAIASVKYLDGNIQQLYQSVTLLR